MFDAGGSALAATGFVHAMTILAKIYPISTQSYDAAMRGDFDHFEPIMKSRIDLDQYWHAIHYLLTGDATCTLLLSGTQLPIISDHAEVHPPASIRELYERVCDKSLDQIMTNFDPIRFDELNIYRPLWSQDQEPEIRKYLEIFLSKVKEAVEANQGFFIIIM